MNSDNAVVGTRNLIWKTVVTLVLLVPGVLALLSVPQFESLFRSFGADLPALTRAVLANRVFISPTLLAFFAVQVALLIALMITRTLGVRRLFRLSASINLVLVLTLLTSLYLPIFKLGAVV